jgi:hypothetical protein
VAQLAKYKRLLGMARKTIEDQQRSLQNMKREMEAMQRNGSGSASGAALTPAKILRRCDVDGDIWVLLQYEEDASESWRMFATEEALNNFIASTGPRLECPPPCLSPEQSRAVVSGIVVAELTNTAEARSRLCSSDKSSRGKSRVDHRRVPALQGSS